MTIVKVQVPLASSDPDGMNEMLVYDEARRNVSTQPVTDAVKKALGTDKKGYFYGHWSSTVGWAVGDRVKEQGW